MGNVCQYLHTCTLKHLNVMVIIKTEKIRLMQ